MGKQSNKTLASYAHPFFWAPLIVVGDGRQRIGPVNSLKPWYCKRIIICDSMENR
jgi:hypothetical protein